MKKRNDEMEHFEQEVKRIKYSLTSRNEFRFENDNNKKDLFVEYNNKQPIYIHYRYNISEFLGRYC